MREKHKKVIISGYYGFGNIGDEAILSAMVKALRSRMPDLDIVVLTQNDAHTEAAYGVRSVYRKNPLAILKELLGTDLFISGGGGLIQDVTGVSTVQYYLGMVLAAKMCMKKVMFYAQGVGPILTEKGKNYTRHIANMVDFITVRDEESKEEFRSIGVTKPPVVVTADPVLALEPVSAGYVREMMKKEAIEEEGIKIAISIRPWKTDVDYIKIVAKLADHLVQEYGAHIIYIPFQKSQDLEVCEKARSLMKNRASLLEGDYTPEELQGFIGMMDLIVGMRLHSLILAATMNVPMAGIVYDPKVRVFSETLDIPFLDLKGLTDNAIIDMIAAVYQQKDRYRESIARKMEKLKGKALLTARVAESLILGKNPQSALEEAR
jgi:polysaccharide pyruvyl transferase CsaB